MAKDADKLQSRRDVLRVASTLGFGFASAATFWLVRGRWARGRSSRNLPPGSKLRSRKHPRLPFAIAAQLAFPGRQSVAVVGDGGFTQLMGELVTEVKYELPVKIVILKNNSLAEVLFEQQGARKSELRVRSCADRFRGFREGLRSGWLPLFESGRGQGRGPGRTSFA